MTPVKSGGLVCAKILQLCMQNKQIIRFTLTYIIKKLIFLLEVYINAFDMKNQLSGKQNLMSVDIKYC